MGARDGPQILIWDTELSLHQQGGHMKTSNLGCVLSIVWILMFRKKRHTADTGWDLTFVAGLRNIKILFPPTSTGGRATRYWCLSKGRPISQRSSSEQASSEYWKEPISCGSCRGRGDKWTDQIMLQFPLLRIKIVRYLIWLRRDRNPRLQARADLNLAKRVPGRMI